MATKFAVESLVTDIRDDLVTYLRTAVWWKGMSEAEQRKCVAEVSERAQTLVENTLEAVLAHDFPSLSGDVVSFTGNSKDRVVLKVEVTMDEAAWLNLPKINRSRVVISTADTRQMRAGKSDDEVEVDKDQPDLPVQAPVGDLPEEDAEAVDTAMTILDAMEETVADVIESLPAAIKKAPARPDPEKPKGRANKGLIEKGATAHATGVPRENWPVVGGYYWLQGWDKAAKENANPENLANEDPDFEEVSDEGAGEGQDAVETDPGGAGDEDATAEAAEGDALDAAPDHESQEDGPGAEGGGDAGDKVLEGLGVDDDWFETDIENL